MKVKIFFLVFVICILLYACNSDNSSSNNTTGQTPITNVEPPTAEIKRQAVFEQKCALCHGNDGTAGIGNATNLQASKLDSVSTAKIITEGKAGMPPFGPQLTKQEIKDISNYVLTLHK